MCIYVIWMCVLYVYVHLCIYVHLCVYVCVWWKNSSKGSLRSCQRSLCFLSPRCFPCLNASVLWVLNYSWKHKACICLYTFISDFLLLSSLPHSLLYFLFFCFSFSFFFLQLWKRKIWISYFIALFSPLTYGICLTSWRVVISWPWSSDAKDNEKC